MENPSFYDVFERMWQHILTKLKSFVLTETFNDHIENKSNPHDVTAEQVGLAKVDNTSDMEKPISNLMQAALDTKADEYHTHSNYALYSHSHSDYASYSHSHSNYASSSHTHSNATTSKAGFMSASDKSKLDDMSANSNALSAYPIGSIYMSTLSTSPASLFGGSWLRIRDRFLLAAGYTYDVVTMGGESEHTLSIAEMPRHSHSIYATTYNVWEYGSPDFYEETVYRYTSDQVSGNICYSGGNASHNNMPPYLAVYMWRRINDNGSDPSVPYEEVIEEVFPVPDEEIVEEVNP